MTTSAWGTSGGSTAWGTQVDEEEANGGTLGPPPAVLGGTDAFPSLGEAGKVSKKDKRKGKSVSLAEFQGGTSTARGSAFVPSAARRPTQEEDILKSLPTGPRERGDDEEPSRGFGGGGFRGGFGRDRDDDELRAPREEVGPSRADIADDWGKDRKFVPGGSADRGSSGGGGFSGRSYEPSRADEGGSWARGRTSSREDGDDRGSRASSRGGGFEDRDHGPSRADTEERWGSKSFVPSARPPDGPSRSDSGGGWGSRRSSSPPPTGSRPKLALKPRTLPRPDLPPPRSAASSESGHSAAEPENTSLSVPTALPTKRSNPFGAARPREEVLKEQGRDHVKEDSARRGLDRPETAEEANLRARIAEISERLSKDQVSATPAAENGATSTAADQEPQAEGAPEGDDAASKQAPNTEEAGGDTQTETEQQQQQPGGQEELEQLQAELARLVVQNDDSHRYARGGSGRW